jgi:hypothetical protein
VSVEKAYQPKYWNGEGKYQKAYERLHEELVPPMGKAPTADGERLRKLSNQYYRRFNDGEGRLSAQELDRRIDELVKELAAKRYVIEDNLSLIERRAKEKGL